MKRRGHAAALAPLPRGIVVILLASPMLLLPAACAVTAGSRYDNTVDVGVGVDYYDPFVLDYGLGLWGADYGVGPYRGGDRRGEGGARPRGHGYRPAAPSRAMPSIPSGPRGGGGRPSGGRRR